MSDILKVVQYDASEHTRVVNTFLAETELKKLNVFRHFNPLDARIVDIGCGDGVLSREASNRSAEFVLGIDSHPDMINIAKESSKDYGDLIQYQQSFIEECTGDESYDVAIMSYLLNNASTFKQLIQQCRGAASFLKPGGIAIIYNNNPFDVVGGDFKKYGFNKTITGKKGGSKIIYDYRPTMSDLITNYYFNQNIHATAFKVGGFSKLTWKPLQRPEKTSTFWDEYFNREHLPVIGAVAIK